MSKIYIAAKFERRPALRPYANLLWELGHEIVASWLNETKKPEGMSHTDFFRKLAIKDLAEVQSAEIVIVDTFMPAGSGGSQVEFGYALGKHQKNQVYLVGPKRSVFHELVDMHFQDWDELIRFFQTFAALEEKGIKIVEASDKNCYTLPDGSCIGKDCMHDIPAQGGLNG